jgi:ABC-2 type transport system ATP-binding protein
MTAVIQTQNLSRSYGRTAALQGLDLTIPQNAIYALVGPNGAGKTTIIKLLMNILRPTAGTAQVLGQPAANVAGEVFTNIGYVSENQELPEWMTVGYFLDYLRPFYPAWDLALEQHLLRQFDLPLDRKIKHLSRGMKMKVALASVLGYRPALIVLDEPFSGLDPLVRDELIEGLLERAPESTILLSSHDLAEIESFATHVGYLDRGRLLFSEEMATLSDRFREVEITLNQPQPLPATVPSTWLQPQAVGTVIRFTHTGAANGAAAAELAQIFPNARDITLTPMTLRSIFLAIAKNSSAHSSAQKGREV